MDNMFAMHHSMLYTPPLPNPSTSRPSCSSSSSHQPHGPRSGHVTKRPKMPKKKDSSTASKQRNVQASLEAKVEKSRGWNAFFVPLARGMPDAPPSSPVLGANHSAGMGMGMGMGVHDMQDGRGHVEHVEHVGQAQLYGQSQAHMFGLGHGAMNGTGHGHGHGHGHSTPASPTASTLTDLSRETTRSFATVDEFERWAKEQATQQQWVEHAGIPTFELGPPANARQGQMVRQQDVEMDQ